MTLTQSSRRKLAVIASLATTCLALGACFEGHYGGPTSPSDFVVGSGNVVEQSRAVSGIVGARLLGVSSLEIVQGGSEGLVVVAEDNLLPYLRTEVIGGILVISETPGVSLRPNRPILFRLSARVMESVELSGVGSVRCQGLAGDRLTLASAGVGGIECTGLDVRELEIDMAGVGSIRTTGVAMAQRASLVGVGTYDGRALASADARIELFSVGSATVRVSDRLVATVGGSGCIYYIGNPIVESLVTGAGCVRRIE